MAITNNYPDLFYKYYMVVCGDESLSPGLANVYFGLFDSDTLSRADFLRLLDQFKTIMGDSDPEGAVKNKILTDQGLNAVTLSIIKLWYLGVIKPLKTLSGGGYYFHQEALIWKVAQAHPAGLSGGYYGYWSYK